jgi:uncharacterized protein (TIGR04255 family)
MTLASGIFSGMAPRDIPLPKAPLASVISQIRFPMIASIEKLENIGAFQESIRRIFPDMSKEPGKRVSIGPEGIQLRDQTIWRFTSDDRTLIASLASDFIALEAKSYTKRPEFMEVWVPILRSVETCFGPSRSDRIGLRYLNRLEDEILPALPDLVRHEILGILSLDEVETIEHTMAEAVLRFDDGSLGLLARWGMLGAGMTHDTAALPPLGRKSWILDIDAFSEKAEPFEAGGIVGRLDTLADADYRFFRWAVTDSFLRRFGGEI